MNKIYVGNLPFQATQDELTQLFQQFGEIQEVAFIKDRFSNKFKGFVFITFTTQEAAQNALSMDGKDLGGRPMKVSMARAEERRSGGGGGNGRRGGGHRERSGRY